MGKKHKIKILFTIPNFDTAGSGKVVYDLVKNLDKARFEAHICCKHSRGVLFKDVEALGVPIHIFGFCAPYRPFISLPMRILKIKNFLMKHRFQLVHSWHWSSDFTEPLACKLAGIPFVYTKKAMGWGNRAWRWRSKLSTKIITINSDMKRQFFANLNHKTVSIPIGLNIYNFGILEKTHSTEGYHNVNKDDFVITSIVNLVPVKGVEYLLEAVLQLNTPKIKVFIVGDNTSDYGRLLTKKYTSDNIIFTGKKQNIKSYLAVSDMFVMPTRGIGEGQPIAPIEAMLSGRVVIGSNVSGIKDVLKHFPDLLFESENEESLAHKISEIISMPLHERNQLSKRLFEYAVKKYNLVDSVREHETLYISIVS